MNKYSSRELCIYNIYNDNIHIYDERVKRVLKNKNDDCKSLDVLISCLLQEQHSPQVVSLRKD